MRLCQAWRFSKKRFDKTSCKQRKTDQNAQLRYYYTARAYQDVRRVSFRQLSPRLAWDATDQPDRAFCELRRVHKCNRVIPLTPMSSIACLSVDISANPRRSLAIARATLPVIPSAQIRSGRRYLLVIVAVGVSSDRAKVPLATRVHLHPQYERYRLGRQAAIRHQRLQERRREPVLLLRPPDRFARSRHLRRTMSEPIDPAGEHGDAPHYSALKVDRTLAV